MNDIKSQVFNSSNITLEEFKEFAKTVTREEFIKDNIILVNEYDDDYHVLINEKTLECPDMSLGLKTDEIQCGNCKRCWIEAIKTIDFKDDLEKSNNQIYGCKTISELNNKNEDVKTYGIQELLEIEGEFLVECLGSYTEMKVKDNKLFLKDADESKDWLEARLTKYWFQERFMIIHKEKEIEFTDLVYSNEPCRVEYIIHSIPFSTEFNTLSDTLSSLCSRYDDAGVRNIIAKGKWFVRN